MSAFIRKEMRLLAPSFASALLLSLAIWLMPTEPNPTSPLSTFLAFLPFLLCPAMVVMISLNSFGREFSAGTFPSLLTQPIARSRIWWTKTLLLALALAVVAAIWLLSFLVHFRENLTLPEWNDAPVVRTVVLSALVIFSGGLWTVLLFRQVAVAFWFTLLTPAMLLVIVSSKFSGGLEEGPQPALRLALAITCLLYSVAGFFFARWLFLRAQDTQWTGGVITLPEWRGATGWFRRQRQEHRLRPRAALIFKEWRLHQSQFVLAGGLALLHLGAILARKLGGDFKNSPALEFILTHFWVLWLLMPWLIGCAAVAEERKLGTMESQQCQPTRRRTQFIIKFVSTLLISLLLGAVMPLLLEGRKVLPNFQIDKLENYALILPEGELSSIISLFGVIKLWLPLFTLVAIVISTAAISFYVSSFSSNTLQAIAPALLGVLGAYFWWFAMPNIDHNPLWRGWLIHYVGVPVLLPVLVGLMYWNFKSAQPGGNLWAWNTLVLTSALVFVATTTAAIYHRGWELLSPIEPKHGPAILEPNQIVSLRVEGWRPIVKLSDGRVWTSGVNFWNADGTVIAREGSMSGSFLEGTNWTKLAATQRELVGLRNDGSLWVSEEPEKFPLNIENPSRSAHLVRLGSDNDWTNLAAHHFLTAILLKADGTLWELGTNRVTKEQGWPRLRDFMPRRLGTDSDWTAISSEGGRVFLRKKDNAVWVSPKYSNVDTNTLVLQPGFTLYRAPDLDPAAPHSVWAAWKRGSVQVGVFPDGTFRAINRLRQGRKTLGLEKRDIVIGSESDWRAVAGNHHNTTVTLKADGTLWKWDFPEDPVTRPDAAVATKISAHSDWVALAEGWSGVFSLARDGSLWLWRLEGPHHEPHAGLPSLGP
ncbi:MAG TPA: hypothetical protein VK846_13305, partial [Candidatus Limnocylindria bacterium]|nr:hypothetical protein [Candidatus Limnocylindria bacterium]